MTKRMLYCGAKSIGDQYGLCGCVCSTTSMVPVTIMMDDVNVLILDLIRKLLEAKNGEQVILWGDGFQKRELVHVLTVHRMN